MASENGEFQHDWSYISVGGGVSFVMALCVFRFIGPAMSLRYTSSYSSLSKAAKADWGDRIVSNVNSMVSIVVSVYSLLFETDMSNVIWNDSKVARIGCSIIIGYMIADMIIMVLWCEMGLGELIGFIFHHLATVFAYYYVSVYGLLCYFAMIRLLAECSTPAMNQRWFFDATGYPRGNFIVVCNGCLMLVTFFLFRIVTLPVFWYQIWLITGTEPVANLGHLQVTVMYLPSVVLDILNIYWFSKICKGFVKAVRNRSKNTEITANGYHKQK